MKSLSAIAHSFNSNLLIRAADVMLKEKRPLVLVPRELPLHKGHLELMLRVTELGGNIMPPLMTFYNHPENLDDMINYMVGKILDILDIENNLFHRWGQDCV